MSHQKLNFSGQIFGRLTVLTHIRGSRVRCLCVCGRECTKRISDLRRGQTKSCGCYNATKLDGERIGRKFGRLTVTGRDKQISSTGRVRYLYECRCDCGQITSVTWRDLAEGSIRACGCLAIELLVKRTIKPPGEANFNLLYSSYIRGARKRGYSFSITKEQFRDLTKQQCFYCGSLPTLRFDRPGLNSPYIYNGIDRVRNDIGYEIGNVVTACNTCNTAKWDLTMAEFCSWLERLTSNWSTLRQIKEQAV